MMKLNPHLSRGNIATALTLLLTLSTAAPALSIGIAAPQLANMGDLIFWDSTARSAKLTASQLPLLGKPAVVRVVDGYTAQIHWPGSQNFPEKDYYVSCIATGSGFFVSQDGYLVTNAHVVGITQQGESEANKCLRLRFYRQLAEDYRRDPKDLTEDDINTIRARASWKQQPQTVQQVILPDGSHYEFDIQKFGALTSGESKDVAILKIQIENAPDLQLAPTNSVQLQDHITAFGYPGAADQPDVLDDQSLNVVSITDGKISAIKTMRDGSPVLQFSASATHGNSGGPLLNDLGEVVGMVTFGSVGEIQGFSFAVASDTIMEFVRSARINNSLGDSDRLYREGLDLYSQNHYSEAIQRFEQVRQLFPHHSEIDGLIKSSRKHILDGDEHQFPLWPVSLILAIFASVYFAYRQRNGKRMSW